MAKFTGLLDGTNYIGIPGLNSVGNNLLNLSNVPILQCKLLLMNHYIIFAFIFLANFKAMAVITSIVSLISSNFYINISFTS